MACRESYTSGHRIEDIEDKMMKEDTVFSTGYDLDHQSQFQNMDISSTNGVDCQLGQLIDLAESY